MGNSNSRSGICQPRKQMYFLHLINRTWNGVRSDKQRRTSHQQTHQGLSSQSSSECSDCKRCNYQQDSLIFDSESEMAPNAEEEMLAIKPWGLQQEKERLRPPTYNAEDYVVALRRWGRRPLTSVHDSQGTLPSTTSSSSGYVSGGGEMTLRQFTSVSELLNKLRADLRLAFPSFVQEFASDGITLLLETLRGVQLAQSTPPSGQSGPRIGTRKAALDELGCVECLAACAERCADVPRLLSQAQPGLLALAICLTSSLNRSRVLALQLLTKVCQIPGGHGAVSEAVSTLRLRYGEGGRFRFLAGALLAPQAAIALRVAGIAFLNAFLKSAPRTQTRLYIQAEACEAGLEPRVLQEWLNEVDGRSEEQTLTDLLKKEIYKWSQNCVDVDALQKRLARAEETCTILGNKVALLQDQLNKLKMKNLNGYNFNERNVKSMLMDNNHDIQRLSSNGEDEGISSSERSSSPEEDLNQSRNSGSISNSNRPIENKIVDNDQETTIDDVIEELRTIVKDAEEEEDRKDQQQITKDNYKHLSDISSKKIIKKQEFTVNQIEFEDMLKRDSLSNISGIINKNNQEYNFKMDNKKLIAKTSTIVDANESLKIVVKGPDVEEAIVPAILYPQPPRRSPPCLSSIIATRSNEYNIDHHSDIYNCHDDEEDAEEETLGDGSDSLLSASRLKYNKKQHSNNLNNNPSIDIEGRLYLSKNGVTAKDSFINNKEEKIDKKTIRNFTSGNEQYCKYLDVYRQFEPSNGKINDRNRYKSEFERKKLLRRAISHDYLDSDCSNDFTKKCNNKIEGKIRKFESMNSFDNNSLTRNNSNLSRRRKTFDKDNTKNKIRRSESCHQVSYSIRKESYNNTTHGGSDSGLHYTYTTDYDLEPIVLTRQLRPELLEPLNQLTKSLDRIDEGLDTFVDIKVVGNNGTKPSRWSLNNLPLKEKNNQKNANRLDTSSNNNKSRKVSDKGLKGSESHFYHSSVLKNDELYHVDRYHVKNLNQFNTCANKISNSSSENNLPLISSFPCQVKTTSNKIVINDSGIFLSSTGKPYDVFGLGKNRFNAGKYSGNPPPPPPPVDNSLGLRKQSTSAAKHSKVTDIISGLY